MAQFTEEEARRIFARAAEHQHTIDDAPPSLSLEELREIGQAAGLSPESIAKAIADIRTGATAPPDSASFWGVPTTIYRSRLLPEPLTDAMWEGMVSRLRHTFETKGITAQIGQTREWTGTNSTGVISNLHVVATPTPEGTHVTLETSRARESRQIRQVGLWTPALLVALFTVVGIADGGAIQDPAYWVFMTAIASLALLIPLISRMAYSRWGDRRQSEFDALLDQFDLLLRDSADTAEAPLTPDSASSMLNLDELAKEPDTTPNATPSRTRA